jgi:MOSC domain-containing protein YiiM
MNERNICIGDIIRVGEEDGVLLQVSLPRQPCFKLNHRFGIKGFAAQTWKKSRTGWYYRVLEEGWVEVGDAITLVERKYPDWTIERVQEYLHRDRENLAKLMEVSIAPSSLFSTNFKTN